MDAVNCEALTNAVARLAPFTSTTELGTKLLPVRVSVNPGLPAETLEGEMLESEGSGLLTVLVGGVLMAQVGVAGVMDGNVADGGAVAVSVVDSWVLVKCVVLTVAAFT